MSIVKITLSILAFFVFFLPTTNGQLKPGEYSSEYLIRSGSPFPHKKTGMVFPMNVGRYHRADLYGYDKERDILAAKYTYKDDKGNVNIYVQIYPAGTGDDNRFRREYRGILKHISAGYANLIKIKQRYVYYQKDGYKVNGFQARFVFNRKQQLTFRLYECGKWFLKVDIVDNTKDSTNTGTVNDLFVEHFNPVELVKSDPLKAEATFHISPGALQDSLLSGCTIVNAMSMLEWVDTNVDSLERLAGFPTLYLDMYMTGFRNCIAFADTTKDAGSKATYDYINQIRALDKHGFLDEHIMTEFGYVMNVPKGQKFDYDAYSVWIRQNPPSGLYLNRLRTYFIVWR